MIGSSSSLWIEIFTPMETHRWVFAFLKSNFLYREILLSFHKTWPLLYPCFLRNPQSPCYPWSLRIPQLIFNLSSLRETWPLRNPWLLRYPLSLRQPWSLCNTWSFRDPFYRFEILDLLTRFGRFAILDVLLALDLFALHDPGANLVFSSPFSVNKYFHWASPSEVTLLTVPPSQSFNPTRLVQRQLLRRKID